MSGIKRANASVFAALMACVMALMTGCATGPRIDTEAAADANASMGADFLRKKNNDQALVYFRKALGYEDDNFTANWGMAIVNNRLGNPDQARHYYDKTLSLQPSAEIYNSYGAFLCRQGDTAKAVTYFKQAADDPRYGGTANALANAGLCLHRADENDRARGFFQQALAADPSQATALVQMAEIEYADRNYLHARAFIERADAVSRLDADALLLGARIEKAMNDPEAAQSYLQRHNASRPTAALSLSQLEPPPQ